MAAALIAFLLLLFQPAPVTVRDCLLANGYSRAVLETPVTMLAGVGAWPGGLGERVLAEGVNVGYDYLDDSDGARRMVSFHVYGGAVFVFMYKHPDDPDRRRPGEPAGTWHSDCFLRITGLGGQP